MQKILLDYTFLEALIFEKNEKHEIADQLAKVIKKEDYLYIPSNVLTIMMKKLENYNSESIKFVNNIRYSTRIDCSIDKNLYMDAYAFFEENPSLNYTDCLTIEYMKKKGLQYILSFNENFDKIKGIKRLYRLDTQYHQQLNYFN